MPLNHCAPCGDCTPAEFPICGGTPVHVCVYRKGDPQPISAWAAAFCDVPGNENIQIFEDRELTIPMPNYSWESRVPCSHPGGLGTNCGNPMRVHVCNDLNVNVEDVEVDFTDVIAAINLTGGATVVAIESLENETIQGLGAVNTSVQNGTTSLGSAINNLSGVVQDLNEDINGYDSAGNELPAAFWTAGSTLTYVGDKVDTITKTVGAESWTRTFTYSGNNITGISAWVKNP